MSKRAKQARLQNKRYPVAYLDQPVRHPDLKDKSLYYDSLFDGAYPIMQLNGPVLEEATRAMIERVTTMYLTWPKVFAIRFELYFPNDWSRERRLNQDQRVSKSYFTRFIASLEAQLTSYQTQLKKAGQSRTIPLVYCRKLEEGRKHYNRGVHIHVLLMTNGHLFKSAGDYRSLASLSKPAMASFIYRAWTSALSTSEQSYTLEQIFNQGRVHFSRVWHDVTPKGQDAFEAHLGKMMDVIWAGSYLCKADTTLVEKGHHPFQCSQSKAIFKGRGHRQPQSIAPTQVDWTQYHRGNLGLDLTTHKTYPCLDPAYSPYIRPDLDTAWRCLDQVFAPKRECVAFRFEYDLTFEHLQYAQRYKRIAKLYQAIETVLRQSAGFKAHAGEQSFFHVIHSLQSRDNQVYVQGMCFIHRAIYERIFNPERQNNLQDYLAEVLAYADKTSEQIIQQRLRLYQRYLLVPCDLGFEAHRKVIEKELGYLCVSALAYSQASTLYCYP